MTTRWPRTPVGRWLAWSPLLWLFAALLTAASVVSTVRIIHARRDQAGAVRAIAHATIRQIATLAELRLELAGRDLFAPLLADSESAADATDPLSRLWRWQHSASTRRDVVGFDVQAVVRFDGASGRLTSRAAADGARSVDSLCGTGCLAQMSERASLSRRDGASDLHVILDGVGNGEAFVVMSVAAHRDQPALVYGVLTSAASLGRVLFAPPVAANMSQAEPTDPLLLNAVQLDVSSAKGTPLVSQAPPLSNNVPSFPLRGALEGLTARVSLASDRLPVEWTYRESSAALPLLAVLMLSTILVVVVAASSTSRALALARARSEFLAGVSHELRMPLAQILLASETIALDRAGSPEEQRAIAEVSVREAKRLAALLDNLLLYARSGRVTLQPMLKPVAVSPLFGAVAETLQPALDELGQTLEVPCSSSLYVVGDHGLLHQALVNLVDNAMKYGAPGQTITMRAEGNNGAWVRLCVEDQGSGVARGDRKRVFAPFHRLAQHERTENRGTGLGLAVVWQVARACGGRAWVDECASGGARFVVELPLAVDASSERAT